MKLKTLYILFCYLLLIPFSFAQEEENASLFTEEYSDDFQEHFFEGLKQKGIENYDKARNEFLAAETLKPTNIVVTHELAKVYLKLRDYLTAEQYAIKVLNKETTNIWYVDTYIRILHAQGRMVVNLPKNLENNENIKQNLATVLYNRGNLPQSLEILKSIKNLSFKTDLTEKITALIKLKKQQITAVVKEPQKQVVEENLVTNYNNQLKALIAQKNYNATQKLAAEALENYPAQPYFYYAEGWALNGLNKQADAIEILESGLDFLIDSGNTANNIYRELGNAYLTIGNKAKSNLYFSKIKK